MLTGSDPSPDSVLENGQSYDTTVHQFLTQDAVNAYQPGGKFQIKADPDDTSKVMLYGQA